MENFNFNKIENIYSPDKERRLLFKRTTLYINAGGRGKRLEPVLEKDDRVGVTKALIEISSDETDEEETAIEYHVRRGEYVGFGNIIVGAGDHKSVRYRLEEAMEENAVLDVQNFSEQLDTGGDLIRTIRQKIRGRKPFGIYTMVENVDTFALCDEAKILEVHKRNEAEGALATIVLTRRAKMPNENAWAIDKHGRVIGTREGGEQREIPENQIAYRGTSTGMVIFNTEWLKKHPWKEKAGRLSIYRDLLPELVRQGALYAYDNGELMVYDIGTPENYAKTVNNPAFREILRKNAENRPDIK